MALPVRTPSGSRDVWCGQRGGQMIASGTHPRAIWWCVLVWIGLLALPPIAGHTAENTNVDLEYAQGVLAYGNRDYLEALDQLRQAVALAPDNPDVQFYLGLTLTRIGEFEEAISALERTLQLDASKRYVHYHLGLAYFQAARYEPALGHFEDAIQFDPQKATAHFFLGYTHYQLKQYTQALPAFEQAQVLDPALATRAQYYRGLTFYALERDAQAQTMLKAVATAEPTSSFGTQAQQYLEAIASRARDRQLIQAQGVVSFQYDDNVTIADDDLISRESDGRTVFAVVGRFLPVRTTPWRVGIEYSLFQSLHFDLSAFDLQSHTAKGFARFKLSRMTWHTALDYTYTGLDNDRFSEAFTVQPGVTVQQTDRLFAVVLVRYRHSNYFNQFIPPGQQDVRDRDGWQVQPGIDQYVLFNRRRSYVRLSYHFGASRNDGSDWEYDSHQIGLGLHTPVGWGIDLEVDGAYRRRNYLHVNSFDAGQLAVLDVDLREREDDRFTASVVLKRDLGRYLILSVGYAHTSNGSNIDFFEYNRNIWSVALTGRY